MSDSGGSAKRMRFPVGSPAIPSLDSFSDKLVVEILIRLPCKSCFKCKSVSKRWFSLISQPYFIGRFICHHQQSLRISSNMYVDYMNTVTTGRKRRKKGERPFVPPEPIELPFTVVTAGFGCQVLLSNPAFRSGEIFFTYLPGRPGHVEKPCVYDPCNPVYGPSGYYAYSVRVLASSSDLLLCCASLVFNSELMDYYICNPLTKQWVRLPEPPRAHKKALIGLITEPFYRCSDEGVVNLNFHSSYKVVRLIEESSIQTSAIVEMFSSETGKWRVSRLVHGVNLQAKFNHPWGIFREETAVIANDGRLFWWWSSNSCLVTYNPFRNYAHTIESPENMSLDGRMGHIGACNGRIRISQLVSLMHDFEVQPCFRIWELVDSVSGKWQKVCKVTIKKMISKDAWLAKRIRSSMDLDVPMPSIHIHPHDGNLVFLVYEWRIALYNIRTKVLSAIGKSRSPRYGHSHDEHAFLLQLQSWPSPIHPYQTI